VSRTTVPIVILFALNREARPFLRQIRRLRKFESAPCQTWLCQTSKKPFLTLITGPGYEAADKATRWLLEEFVPTLVVSAGFAGALTAEHKIGDVILSTRVMDADETTWRTSIPLEIGELGCGSLLTWPTVVTTAKEKRELFDRFGASVVDLESAAIADRCAHKRVRFAAIRAVSDDADTSFSPRLASLIAGGTLTPRQAVVAMVCYPGLIGEFWRLAADTRTAAHNLAAALLRILG
jgi:nucleoside phosphorylase